MSEFRPPGRLLDPASQCSPLARQLLEAAKADAPSRRRASAVVAAALASTPARHAGPAPHISGIRPMRGASRGVSTAAKVVAGAGVIGCLAFVLARGTGSNDPAERAVGTAPVPVPMATSLPTSGPRITPQAPEVAPVEREPPTVSVEDLPSATPTPTTGTALREEPKGVRPVAPAAPPVDQGSLDVEIEQLRAAREAIRRGAPQNALDRLGAYSRQFPNGLLKPEAEAMAIEAELAAGRTAQARMDADAFLAAHAESPQAPRIRRLREELEP